LAEFVAHDLDEDPYNTGEVKTVAGKGKGRLADSAYRTREHFEPGEVQAIAEAARDNRDGARDWLMIVMAYRHGLWVGELRWTDVHREAATLTVRHVKGSKGCTQPLQAMC
jgi:type 1 fimbriae regulatory protein FimB/type 1 fimbriae regulatory protein FimE